MYHFLHIHKTHKAATRSVESKEYKSCFSSNLLCCYYYAICIPFLSYLLNIRGPRQFICILSKAILLTDEKRRERVHWKVNYSISPLLFSQTQKQHFTVLSDICPRLTSFIFCRPQVRERDLPMVMHTLSSEFTLLRVVNGETVAVHDLGVTNGFVKPKLGRHKNKNKPFIFV